jgi:NADH-quinone oxidoreductase subunit L
VEYIKPIIALIVFLPLVGAIIAGLLGQVIGRTWSHRVTISGVGISFVLSLAVAKAYLFGGAKATSFVLYQWASGGNVFPFKFHVGFLIDPLSSLMLLVVTFVSFMVHIYSMGYMADDDGYQRFFSYISLFTFAMLMLVTANNFLQLFFGWEGVGLVSYLLIGFWFKRESANQGSMKAFLVNRVGDFGFILGIGLIMANVGSLDYADVFSKAAQLLPQHIALFSGHPWSLITVICLLLFVGAMGKSAQVPLHVWLPESMEGPTPISALIHAATMVTAGVFMVARMSPLFEHSTVALSFVLVIGATGALFTGLLAVVMTDIKRVIAYSTLSQLGYMMVAMGCSAYAAGMFHLATHACFKAVLFLAAGSVIIAMHHEQDMRKMGGLWRYMPITYVTYLIGSLALVAVPPFAGFYSKDIIIEAAHLTTIPGGTYAYYCVLFGAFVTGLYTFRSLIMTFHGKERMDDHTREHLQESPWSVTLPLVMLAIPSVVLGILLIGPMLFDSRTLLQSSLYVLPQHNVLAEIGKDYHGPWAMILEAVTGATFYFAMGGILVAILGYVVFPTLPEMLATRFKHIYQLLMNKYGFDTFYDKFFVRGSRRAGDFLFNVGDKRIIDGFFVNGSGMAVRFAALRGRVIQSGYLYHYATAMVVGLLGFLIWMVLK